MTAVTAAAQLPNTMDNPSNDPMVTPSPDSKETDFDFLLGRHVVHHEKLRYRPANCHEWVKSEGTHRMEPLLSGFGNIEQHRMTGLDGEPMEGAAVRLFNPRTRLWSIYWADSRSVTLDNPVVGSFDHGIGHFYGSDTFNGKPIRVQFCWDARDPQHPVWSQAFSTDNGKTNTTPAGVPDTDTTAVGEIELRDYLIKPGERDRFIDYFEANFIESQRALGGYVLGAYRVKNNEDNFFWMRGFRNMESRSAFLPAFYFGPFWKQHRVCAEWPAPEQ